MFMFYVLCPVYCLLCTVVGMRGKGNFGPLYVCTYIGLTIKLSDSDSDSSSAALPEQVPHDSGVPHPGRGQVDDAAMPRECMTDLTGRIS